MAYNGISPYLFNNNLTNVQLLDDISGSFNGSTKVFNLTTNGAAFHAVSSRSLLIVLGGILQKPEVDYTVSSGQITFTIAPIAGLTFAARNVYGLNALNTINDGLITPAKLSLGGPYWDTSGNVGIGTTNLAPGGGTPFSLYIKQTAQSRGLRILQQTNDPEGGAENIIAYFGNKSFWSVSDSASVQIGFGRITNVYTSSGVWDFTFLTGSSASPTEKLRITGGGNVGIGTTNPSSKLHVYNGDLELTGGYNLTWGGTFSGGNPTIWGNASNKTIRFAPDGNTTGLVALLGASLSYILGNVGIGTTNPDYKLHVNGSSIGFGTNGGSFNQRILNGGTGDYTIEMDTTERVRITGTGGNLLPGADATQNLGSTTKRWNNVYTTDLQLSNEGSSNDVDGTWGQYTIQEGENDLFLLNRRNGKKYKFVLQEVN